MYSEIKKIVVGFVPPIILDLYFKFITPYGFYNGPIYLHTKYAKLRGKY